MISNVRLLCAAAARRRGAVEGRVMVSAQLAYEVAQFWRDVGQFGAMWRDVAQLDPVLAH